MKNFKFYFKYCLIILLFVFTVFVWYAVYSESRKDILVAFLDVGQGDAVFVRAPNGNQILIDGGPNKQILSELSSVMPFYDRTIDALILTHSHEDHLNGLIEVLKRYKVGAVLEPGNEGETPAYAEFEKIIKEKKIRHLYVKRGTKISVDENTFLNIFLPVFNLRNGGIHDQMVVGQLIYGKTKFLLTGDMESNLENYLISLYGNRLKSEVLKAGHHGSRTSTSLRFLGTASPEYAVISAGKNNKYGHPHKEILDRLTNFGVKFFRTDLDGLIKFTSDGEKVNAFVSFAARK